MTGDTFVTTQRFGIEPDDLTRAERALFRALARDASKVITKADLMRATRIPTTLALDSTAARLRVKLGGGVTNVWGVGYRLDMDDAR